MSFLKNRYKVTEFTVTTKDNYKLLLYRIQLKNQELQYYKI